jgi:hypothetical protein
MLPLDRHVTRSSVIVLIPIIACAASGFLLQTVRASDEAALVEDIATHVKMNRIELQRLQGELDQLQKQLSSETTSLHINYDYLRMHYSSGNGRVERCVDLVLTRKPIVI